MKENLEDIINNYAESVCQHLGTYDERDFTRNLLAEYTKEVLNNIKIYFVWHDRFEDCDLGGIFTNLENAEKFIKENWTKWFNCCWIEEWGLDDNSLSVDKTVIKDYDIIIDSIGDKHLTIEFDRASKEELEN